MLGTAGLKAGAGACCPSTAGLPKLQHRPAVPTESSWYPPAACKSVLRAVSFCHCSHREQAEKNIQRYSCEVSGLLTYLKHWFPWRDKLRSVVFIRKDVRLLLLTVSICSQTGSGEGQWDQWSGLCKQTLETQNKSVTEVCGQRQEKRKPLLLFAQQILVILQNCTNQLQVCLLPCHD